MAGISRFRKGNNQNSNANKAAVTTETTAQIDESNHNGNDRSIQDQSRSNDTPPNTNPVNETVNDAPPPSLAAAASVAAESMHCDPDQSHNNESPKDPFDSIMEHQESHFDINDSIVDMDLCDLNFTNFENDDSILPYSNDDGGFHVHDDGFQNDGEEKEQVSQHSNEKSSSTGLSLFRNRKKPLEHVEGGREKEMDATTEETDDTLHDEKEQEHDATRSVSNDQESNMDVCENKSNESNSVHESSASSEPQDTDQNSSSPVQVSHEHGVLPNDISQDEKMEQVEIEQEIETTDVVMDASLDDAKSISHESKISSNPTEQQSIEIEDDDQTMTKHSVSATLDPNASSTCTDVVSTSCVDKVTTEVPLVGMAQTTSSAPRKKDDISKTNSDSTSADTFVSLEGENARLFPRVPATTHRVLPMPPPPRKASHNAQNSVEKTVQIDPAMPAPVARNIANGSRSEQTNGSRSEQMSCVSRDVPGSSSKSRHRVVPGINQTPVRPRATTVPSGNSINSMTNLNCGNEARDGINPITPSPRSNWNHDMSRENRFTSESSTDDGAATHNHLIFQTKQLTNKSVGANQNISSQNEKEERFDAFKDKFEKDIVESNDVWDRSDADLIELNLGLVMMDNMALRLHSTYGELLEDIEELLVS